MRETVSVVYIDERGRDGWLVGHVEATNRYHVTYDTVNGSVTVPRERIVSTVPHVPPISDRFTFG